MQSPLGNKASVVAVGTFDGVHSGHRAVINKVIDDAHKRNLRPLIVTFDPHPLAVVAPERKPLLLESPASRCRQIREMGAEPVLLKFDEAMRSKTAAEWMQILREEYGAEEVVVGYDNTFGCDGMKMSIAEYKELGSKLGIDVEEAPLVQGISSSEIRRRLASGDVEEASSLLGYPFAIEGIVSHGKGLGHKIGFPTANIRQDDCLLLPAPGVYVADVLLPGSERKRGVVNIGSAPTIGSGTPVTVEVYIIGYDGDLYNRKIKIELLHRIRDERRFSSIEELKSRIAEDVAIALAH